MSFVSGVFSGDKGTNFQAQQAPLSLQNTGQLTGDYRQGLSDYQRGLSDYRGTLSNQGDLAGQLRAQNAGQGPNPAAAMLNQATQQNIQNAAGMAASQKGLNPALAARMAGQNAASANQQAAGQAATMRANQILANQQQLQGLYGTMAGESLNQGQMGLGQSQMAQNAIAAQNNALVGQQSNINNANASIAGINAQGQHQLFSNVLQGAGSAAMLAEGGKVPEPTHYVPHYADGGEVSDKPKSKAGAFFASMGKPQQSSANWGQTFGKGLASLFGGKQSAPEDAELSSGAAMAGAMGANPMIQNMMTTSYLAGKQPSEPEISDSSNPAFAFKKGGKVPAMLSPGEIYLPPAKAKAVAQGKESPMSGKKIPGKAPVKGDSLKNDIVPAMLEPGGVVVKRSKANDPKKAAQFVAGVLRNESLRRKK